MSSLLSTQERTQFIQFVDTRRRFPSALLLLFRNLLPRETSFAREKCFSSRVLFSDHRVNACFFSLSLSLFTNYTRNRFCLIRLSLIKRRNARSSRLFEDMSEKQTRKRSRPTAAARFRGRQSRRAPRRSRRSGGEISQRRGFASGDEERRHRGRAGFEFKNRTIEKLGRRGGTI